MRMNNEVLHERRGEETNKDNDNEDGDSPDCNIHGNIRVTRMELRTKPSYGKVEW